MYDQKVALTIYNVAFYRIKHIQFNYTSNFLTNYFNLLRFIIETSDKLSNYNS